MAARSDKGQRQTRTRSTEHAARQNKGHPRREARRRRAQERLGELHDCSGPPDYTCSTCDAR